MSYKCEYCPDTCLKYLFAIFCDSTQSSNVGTLYALDRGSTTNGSRLRPFAWLFLRLCARFNGSLLSGRIDGSNVIYSGRSLILAEHVAAERRSWLNGEE
jgi:hypothetical protein